MRTETLIKMLSRLSNLFEREIKVRLNGKLYAVSHVENKKDKSDVIVIYSEDKD